ncbi:hypothetical protein SAMN05216567_101267 [Variovorax sp. OK605]|jgi:hypothetical protein|uniref:hypothetical protein n=1 Tax=unclassified Variovorax TaxID=663243 RepID=UPI0008B2FCD8|nr:MULTISPECIES: hypothetical protein [unclassified Variovorax]SEJ76579.1 hypothetical protein SAMN05518853_103470 [Variovorax sp. OK202]SFC89574.1 hypothetical protein SAMN05444746_103470 [Variovorax sp. OK212]SFO54933.1 hypothetical protein SAMN05216567_101267 [Variovorax sp. OK605]
MEILMWIVFAVLMGSILVVALSVVIVASRENRVYSAEARTWQRLAQSGIPTQAEVESLKRSEHELSRGGSQGQTVYACELALKVFDGEGGSRPAVVRTLIDEGLVPQFAVAGTRVHLLRDPGNAAVLAVDRTRTPLEIPRATA